MISFLRLCTVELVSQSVGQSVSQSVSHSISYVDHWNKLLVLFIPVYTYKLHFFIRAACVHPS